MGGRDKFTIYINCSASFSRFLTEGFFSLYFFQNVRHAPVGGVQLCSGDAVRGASDSHRGGKSFLLSFFFL